MQETLPAATPLCKLRKVTANTIARLLMPRCSVRWGWFAIPCRYSWLRLLDSAGFRHSRYPHHATSSHLRFKPRKYLVLWNAHSFSTKNAQLLIQPRMAEAIVVIGLVSAMVQFVDFSTKVRIFRRKTFLISSNVDQTPSFFVYWEVNSPCLIAI